MDIEREKKLIATAAHLLQKDVEYFSELDAMTGDGDHGVTIGRLAEAIAAACEETSSDSALEELFYTIFQKAMDINGGCAGTLWAQMFSGVSEAATDAEQITPGLLRTLYQGALDGLREVSDAKLGEKTMLFTIFS